MRYPKSALACLRFCLASCGKLLSWPPLPASARMLAASATWPTLLALVRMLAASAAWPTLPASVRMLAASATFGHFLSARCLRDWKPAYGIIALGCFLSSYMVFGVVNDGKELTVNPVLLKVIEEVDVPALQEGSILDILVTEGQVVQVGQAILQIDDQRARLKNQQAELEYRIAIKKATNQSELRLAEMEVRVTNSSLQRALDSRKKYADTPSQAEVDDIELRVAQAKQHLDQATHDSQLADLAKDLSEKNLALTLFEVDRHKIKAPIQGAITEIIAKRGEWVRPGEPLVRIIRIDRLRVEGNLKREYITPRLKDSAVTLVIEGSEGGNGRFPGKIVFISPEVDPNDRTQRIVAEVDNSAGLLGPGLRAKMLIHSN